MGVAVIIPVYNASAYLEEAVASCLIQREVEEIVLVDDASTDNSPAIAEQLARNHPNIKFLSMPDSMRRGPAAARNRGIAACTSEFIAFLDADDVYLENRFSHALQFLKNHPDFDAYYVASELFTEDLGQSLGLKHMWKPVQPEQLFRELLLGRSGHFHTSGILLRRSALTKSGNFNETLRWHQDTELWLRLAFHCRLAGQVGEPPLAKIRQHGKNHSQNAHRKSRVWLWESALNYFKTQKTGAYNWYLLLLRLGIDSFKPPQKKEYLALIPLLFRYPLYFWIWLKKWIQE